MIKRRDQSAGTAIFMAMLMVAIVAGITVALMQAQKIDIRRTQLMFNSEQAYLYSQGIIGWAKGAILANMQNPQQQTITWPLVLPPTTIAGGAGKIAGTLQDAEGLFNINNFQQKSSAPNPQQQQQVQQKQEQASLPPQLTPEGKQGQQQDNVILANLMNELSIPLATDQQNIMIQAINAWNSKPVNPSSNLMDAFDNEYMQKNPSYRAPHAPMVSVSELRLVQGMTPEAYQALLPYIVALPTKTTINAKHAPLPIQKALGEKAPLSTSPDTTQSLGTYFLLRGDVYLGNQHMVLFALLQKGAATPGQTLPPGQPNPGQQGISPPPAPPSQASGQNITVLWQSFGTL